jgi:hypothetical protein
LAPWFAVGGSKKPGPLAKKRRKRVASCAAFVGWKRNGEEARGETSEQKESLMAETSA